MNSRLELAGLNARAGIATGIDHLQRQLNQYNDELENLIEEQIDALKKEASELKAKATKASGETKAAIENHLVAVELRLRKERAKLQDSFEERLLEMKQWFENLHVRSALAQAEVRDKLQASIKAAQNSLAELRAHVRMRNREDERAWKDIRHGFNKAWRELENAFDKANRERA
jgi:soluble cytochrome b562